MNRNCLFNKALALLLCAVMLIGCLPGIALPAAAEEQDWETDIDVVTTEATEPPVGSESNPAVAALYNNTATVEAGVAYYWTYTADYTGTLIVSSEDSTFTVNGGDATSIAVNEGDVVSIVVTNAEAGDSNIYIEYLAGSCAAFPVFLGSMENSVTNAGTVYYQGYFSGTTMTVTGEGEFVVTYNGTEYEAVDGVVSIPVTSANPRMPVEFSVTGDGDYTINFAYPVGSQSNPAVAALGDNACSIEAGNTQGYYWTYTADYTGDLVVTISGAEGWTYVINNMTAGTYGDTQWSDSDPVVNPSTVAVTAGDEIQIIVNTYDPADMWNNPAGDITVNLAYEPGSCPEAAIFLGNMENSVTNAGTVYYQGYFSGTTMTVTGEGEFVVTYNGTEYEAVDGVVSIPVTSANPRMPVEFSVTGDGDYTINFAYPVGSQSNPAVAVLGDNLSTIEAGSQGYYWTYIADETGDLVVTISGAEGWSYVINNMTTYAYGDTQWSDSDPVVNPATVSVTEGDEIQIIVNTYDAADPWNAPAGSITVNLAYEPEGPIVDESLKFLQIGLSLVDYIGVQPLLQNKVVNSYDSYYVEAVQTVAGGDPKTTILEPIPVGTSYTAFDLQLLPNEMTEEITFTIYAEKDGQVYTSVPLTTSIKALAEEKLVEYSESDDLDTCRILVDMLNYGAEVQEAFYAGVYATLPNADLGDYASLGTSETPEISATKTVTGSGLKVYNDTLSLASKVEVQFLLKAADVEGYEMRYTLGGNTVTVPAEEFTSITSTYDVALFALQPTQFRQEFTVAFYDTATGDCVSAVYTASAEAYAADALGGTYNDAVIAMMKYGDAVYAVFG